MHPLESDRSLIVYLDIKSPYAYLAKAPTRALASRLGVQVDWRPLVLDIPSFLGSARLDAAGRVAEQRRDAEQWSSVKYSYFDCRRYANLRGLTLRGTVKIWDTNPVSVGWLWARRQGDEVLHAFLDGVYEPFWKRQLDVEDPAEIARLLAQAGADLSGFDAWRIGEGAALNAALQADAFRHGIFGVPSYVIDGQTWFGREQLPRLEWLLSGARGRMPDPACECVGTLPAQPVRELTFVVDFTDPHSYLALPMMLRLARTAGLPVTWLTQPATGRARHREEEEAPDPARADRGELHKWKRAASRRQELERHDGNLPSPTRRDDTRLADLALAFVQRHAPGSSEFIERLFSRRWEEGGNLSDAKLVRGELERIGRLSGFDDFLAGAGSALPDERQRRSPGVPAVLLDDEPFVGRQHEPLLRRRLGLPAAGN